MDRSHVEEELLNLYVEHEDAFAERAWVDEEDRWRELVFCTLLRWNEDAAPAVREALDTLGRLGLDAPQALARLVPGSPERAAATLALTVNGYAPEAAGAALDAVQRVASAVQARHAGLVQRFLRAQAEAARDAFLREVGDDSPELRVAVTHWLQNVTSLPLLLEDGAVERFVAARGIKARDLVDIADDLQVNVAVVDDLVRLAEDEPVEDEEEATTLVVAPGA